jgi:hypothetical protein
MRKLRSGLSRPNRLMQPQTVPQIDVFEQTTLHVANDSALSEFMQVDSCADLTEHQRKPENSSKEPPAFEVTSENHCTSSLQTNANFPVSHLLPPNETHAISVTLFPPSKVESGRAAEVMIKDEIVEQVQKFESSKNTLVCNSLAVDPPLLNVALDAKVCNSDSTRLLPLEEKPFLFLSANLKTESAVNLSDISSEEMALQTARPEHHDIFEFQAKPDGTCFDDEEILEEKQSDAAFLNYGRNASNFNMSQFICEGADKHSLLYWQVPVEINARYAKVGISKLYDWQVRIRRHTRTHAHTHIYILDLIAELFLIYPAFHGMCSLIY